MPKVKSFTKVNAAKLPLPPRGKQTDFFEHLKEGRSLILSLSYGGRRSWSVLYYDQSKPRRAKLGEFPTMDPATARTLAHDYDVAGALNRNVAGSFGQVAEDWYQRVVIREKLISAPESRRLLDRHVLPRWRDRPFVDVRRKDVIDLIEDTIDAHAKGTRRNTDGKVSADSILAVVRRITNWFASRDENYRPPVTRGLRKDLRLTRPPRQRWLSNTEIAAVWNACEEMDTFGALLRLLLLTGQRLSKVAGMKWSDLHGNEWRIPHADREKGTPGCICLPELAMKVINGLPHIADNPFVIASHRRAGVALAAFAEYKAAIDALPPADMQPWVLHDLRRTCRKLLTRTGVRVDVAEMVLGHSIQGIQKIYDDPIEYQPAINEALTRVAAEIDRLVNPQPANVVPLVRTG